MSAFDDAYDALPEALQEDDMFVGLFEEMFNENLRGDEWYGVHDALEDYLWDEYDLALDDFIDWDDYGEWYDSTH